MTIYRLRPYQDARQGPQRKASLWRRFVNWLSEPPKAQILKWKNPTQWKLSRVRRAARSRL